MPYRELSGKGGALEDAVGKAWADSSNIRLAWADSSDIRLRQRQCFAGKGCFYPARFCANSMQMPTIMEVQTVEVSSTLALNQLNELVQM